MTLFPTIRRRSEDLLRRPFSSLFDELMQWNSPTFATRLPETFTRGMIPPVNIGEDEKSLSISLEMPGLDEKDIKLEVLGQQLLVSAERKFESDKKEKDFHRIEQEYGSFSRTIQLPTGLKTDQIEAIYKKGILTLTIPKIEPTPTRKITVKKGD
jgi:HSP20 family protein